MRTDQERLELLHRRAAELKMQQKQRLLAIAGGLCAVFLIVLAARTADLSVKSFAPAGGMYSGSSLLNESVGGYVLVGVVSFAAAVMITVFCMRRRYRGEWGGPWYDRSRRGMDPGLEGRIAVRDSGQEPEQDPGQEPDSGRGSGDD